MDSSIAELDENANDVYDSASDELTAGHDDDPAASAVGPINVTEGIGDMDVSTGVSGEEVATTVALLPAVGVCTSIDDVSLADQPLLNRSMLTGTVVSSDDIAVPVSSDDEGGSEDINSDVLSSGVHADLSGPELAVCSAVVDLAFVDEDEGSMDTRLDEAGDLVTVAVSVSVMDVEGEVASWLLDSNMVDSPGDEAVSMLSNELTGYSDRPSSAFETLDMLVSFSEILSGAVAVLQTVFICKVLFFLADHLFSESLATESMVVRSVADIADSTRLCKELSTPNSSSVF